MSTADRIISEYTDIAGGYLRSGGWIDKGQAAATLAAAIQAATNANLLYLSRGDAIVGTTTPAGATWPLVTDLAIFNFQTTAGAGLQVIVPAPLQALFLPDNITIDASATLSAAIIAAVIGTLTDVSGNAATAFSGGVKGSRRTEQNG